MALDRKRFDEAENFGAGRQLRQLGPVRLSSGKLAGRHPPRTPRACQRGSGDSARRRTIQRTSQPTSANPVTAWSGQPPLAATPASYQTASYQTAVPMSRRLPSLGPMRMPAVARRPKCSCCRRWTICGPATTRWPAIDSNRRCPPFPSRKSPVASFGGSGARPTLPPNGVLVQGSSPPPVYFPVRRDQPSINAPFTAQKTTWRSSRCTIRIWATTRRRPTSKARACRRCVNRRRRALPSITSTSAATAPGDGQFDRAESGLRIVGAAGSSGVHPAQGSASPEAQALSPQLSWMERMSQPIPPQGAPHRRPVTTPRDKRTVVRSIRSQLSGHNRCQPIPSSAPLPTSPNRASSRRSGTRSSGTNRALASVTVPYGKLATRLNSPKSACPTTFDPRHQFIVYLAARLVYAKGI